MSDGKFKDKVYHLRIKATWREDLRLKSITEEGLQRQIAHLKKGIDAKYIKELIEFKV